MKLIALLCLLAAGWIAWTSWGPALRLPVPAAPSLPVPVPPRSVPVPLPRPPRLTLPRPAARITSDVQRILIEKGARRMTVFQAEGNPRVMQIALGKTPRGDKIRQGDGKTPEGLFRIDRRNAQSRFHLSLGLDYPRPQDRKRAAAQGVDPGGDIMIHGQPNQVAEGYKVKGDWTDGCIALTNPEIAELFAHARIGTEVEIRP